MSDNISEDLCMVAIALLLSAIVSVVTEFHFVLIPCLSWQPV